jgi:hypothetical protein
MGTATRIAALAPYDCGRTYWVLWEFCWITISHASRAAADEPPGKLRGATVSLTGAAATTYSARIQRMLMCRWRGVGSCV